MPDSTTFNPPLSAKAVGRGKTAGRDQSRAPRAGSFTLWAGLIAGASLALLPIAQYSVEEVQTRALIDAGEASIMAALEQVGARSASPDRLETLSELSLQLAKPDTGSAYAAARRATELDPSRAFAWANLAWLERQRASGRVTPAVIDALRRSMDACPLCDQGLIGWRFNFVLANWTSMPEALRQRAFEHADLLRWNGPNAEFLADMRAKARAAGIPFDAYAAAVNTPAKPWEFGGGKTRLATAKPLGGV